MDLLPRLNRSQKASLVYHSRFAFPLTAEELVRWQAGRRVGDSNCKISSQGNFFFLLGQGATTKRRLAREKFSQRKLRIARRAAEVLGRIPTVKFVGVTGSLAMLNAAKESDIDLIVIVAPGLLWTTRLLAFVLLSSCDFALRRAGDKRQKDKLCLNLWLDMSDLVWRDRNAFTAHEIAQIVSLVNKNQVYEQFLAKNKWVLDYWPQAVTIRDVPAVSCPGGISIFWPLEKLAFFIQYQYMKSKITNEVITSTRAQFHPQRVTTPLG